MEILLILILSGLATVKAGASGARDYALAKQGQLPPRAQQQIEAMKAAGQLSKNSNVAPRDAFKTMRQAGGGAGQAYWKRLKDDTWDGMRERHERRDAKRRGKRQAKAEGTYQPGAFKTFTFDVKDGLWKRWDRAWDKATDRRERQRRERQQPDDPGSGSGTDPASPGPTPPDPLSNDPQPEAEPAPESEPDSGAGRLGGDSADPPNTTSEPEATPADAPEPKPAQSTEAEATPEPVCGTDAASVPHTESHIGTHPPTEQEEQMAEGMTPSSGADGDSGDITSLTAMAIAEERIEQITQGLCSNAERILDQVGAQGMDVEMIQQGIEHLQTSKARWSDAAQRHRQAAVTAAELQATHEGAISDSQTFNTQDA